MKYAAFSRSLHAAWVISATAGYKTSILGSPHIAAINTQHRATQTEISSEKHALSVHCLHWITLSSPAAPSALFGCSGELWDKSRLLDWSYAGYMYGDYQLPKLPAMADVLEVFGAKGDGVTDDTAAFELALNMLPQQGTLLLPRGVYVIKRVSRRVELQCSW